VLADRTAGPTLRAVTANIIAGLALLVSIVGAVYATRLGRRSAEAAEASVNSADRAADAAKDSARSAAQVATAELERDHESWRPPMGTAAFTRIRNDRTRNMNLFLEFSLPRSYRIEGDAITGESRSTLSIAPGPAVEGGRLVRIFVDELLPQNQHQAAPQLLRFRIWPPVDGDAGDYWTCPCGRNTSPEGQPHWEWSVPVPKQPDPTVMILN
jgi:hypothetical protein